MKKRYKFWFGAVAALVVLIALLLVLQLLRMDVNAFAERYKNSLWTIPIVVFLYLLKAVTMVFLPQPLVYLITGLLFSPLVAFLVTVGGLSLEFTLDYFLGRRFGSRLLLPLLDRLRGRSRTLDRVLQSDTLNNFGTIALLRLMPGLATDPVSFIAGANKVRFRPFLSPRWWAVRRRRSRSPSWQRRAGSPVAAVSHSSRRVGDCFGNRHVCTAEIREKGKTRKNEGGVNPCS